MELGLVKEEDVLEAVTTQYSIPYIQLDSYDINPEAIGMIPDSIALKYLFMPMEKIGMSFTVAMSNPLNDELITEIESITQCNVQTVVSTPSDIIRMIGKYYPQTNNCKQ